MNRLRTVVDDTIHLRDTPKEDSVLFFSIILLETNVFLEEYHNQFTQVEVEYSNRVKDVKQIAQPIIRRINQWKDIRKFRSQIIAHNWRDKQNNFVIPDISFYDIPRNALEYQILSDLLGYVIAIINAEFVKEVEETQHYFESIRPQPVPPTDYSNLNRELEEIQAEVFQSCRKLNKSFGIHFTLYTLPNQK